MTRIPLLRRTEEPPKKRGWGRSVIYAVLIVVMLGVNYSVAHRATVVSRARVPYNPFFLDEVREGNVASITSRGTAIQGMFRKPTPFGSARPTRFDTEIPAFANTNALSELLQDHGVVVNAQPLDQGVVWWKSLLFGFGPTLLLLALLIWIFRRFGRPQSILGNFGRSRARRYDANASAVTFADVAGIDEAKLELVEIVDFLRNPEKYRRLGGRIPRGVLLSGPPGTGKTLLARAVAGEADAPFFSMSASEFVEAIAGIGASRVRDLFAQAKEASPAIVFIDELDAIGRSRTSGSSSPSGDEREQTLNQILTEMDGFDGSSNVIVLGATNRPEILDRALLRPGRFDRRIAVQPPDRNGRREILTVHTREVPLADDVDLDTIAATTPGMVGADLANLVNEAALLAARRGKEQVASAEITDSLERIILGAGRSVMMGQEDRWRIALHEAGHALVAMLTPGADIVRKVSIIPRGTALGVTLSAPEADRFNHTTANLAARIKVALGGRAAEEVVIGDVTTGAEGDIEQVTVLARHMVGRWGMSPAIGMLAVIPGENAGPGARSPFSQRMLERVDDEVSRVVENAHDEVLALLNEERRRLGALATALLEAETLDGPEAYAAAGVTRPQQVVLAP